MHNIFDIPATTQSFRTVSLRRGTGRAQHHTIKDTTQSFRTVSLRRGDEGGGTDTILHTRGHDAEFSDGFLASRHRKGAIPYNPRHDAEFQDGFLASRQWKRQGRGRQHTSKILNALLFQENG